MYSNSRAARQASIEVGTQSPCLPIAANNVARRSVIDASRMLTTTITTVKVSKGFNIEVFLSANVASQVLIQLWYVSLHVNCDYIQVLVLACLYILEISSVPRERCVSIICSILPCNDSDHEKSCEGLTIIHLRVHMCT